MVRYAPIASQAACLRRKRAPAGKLPSVVCTHNRPQKFQIRGWTTEAGNASSAHGGQKIKKTDSRRDRVKRDTDHGRREARRTAFPFSSTRDRDTRAARVQNIYDLIIVGAGPAGATLARLMGRSRSVLLIEARSLDAEPRVPAMEKCCGGLLAPDAQAMLRRFSLDLPADVLDAMQPLAVRALDLRSGISRSYSRSYLNLDRLLFERWLLSMVPERVRVLAGHACTHIRQAPGSDHWQVRVRGPGGETTEHGRLLVGADGANSLVRRTLGNPPRAATQYLALQDWHPHMPGETVCDGLTDGEYIAYFHPAITDFYGWIIPKRKGVLHGLALPLARCRGGGAADLARCAAEELRGRGIILPEAADRRGCLVLRPGPRDVFTGRDGAFLVGEAAGFISPSSAEGYSYAFASALSLSRAMAGRDVPRNILADYRRRTARLVSAIFGKRIKSIFMYTPLLRRAIMASGVLSSRKRAAEKEKP